MKFDNGAQRVFQSQWFGVVFIPAFLGNSSDSEISGDVYSEYLLNIYQKDLKNADHLNA